MVAVTTRRHGGHASRSFTHRQGDDAANHSCWRTSFLAFCLGGRPAIYTIYIPYVSFIHSRYIYNYMHIWRAARNVKNPPANNYAANVLEASCNIVGPVSRGRGRPRRRGRGRLIYARVLAASSLSGKRKTQASLQRMVLQACENNTIESPSKRPRAWMMRTRASYFEVIDNVFGYFDPRFFFVR